MAADNNLHAVALGCLDCHPNHPPRAGTTSLACTECHAGKPHYEISDCLHCHTDPHRPISMLRDPVRPARDACLSCHDKVGTQMSVGAGHHGTMSCTRCHSNHKSIPGCFECHVPHIAKQPERSCLNCHSAHQPLQVVVRGRVPVSYCAPCHPGPAAGLARTRTRHLHLECNYCHAGQHPAQASCQDCHGLPHAQAIHSQFPGCLTCHGDTHALISGGR